MVRRRKFGLNLYPVESLFSFIQRDSRNRARGLAGKGSGCRWQLSGPALCSLITAPSKGKKVSIPSKRGNGTDSMVQIPCILKHLQGNSVGCARFCLPVHFFRSQNGTQCAITYWFHITYGFRRISFNKKRTKIDTTICICFFFKNIHLKNPIRAPTSDGI